MTSEDHTKHREGREQEGTIGSWVTSLLSPLFAFLGLPPWWYIIPLLSALGLGGTVSVHFLSPYREVFYALAGLFAVIGFYINVIRDRKLMNVTVYTASMLVLLYLLVFA